MRKFGVLLCTLAILTGTCSALMCTSNAEAVGFQSIQDILDNPEKYEGANVTIIGEVVQGMTVAGEVAALVSDGEAVILVLGQGELPDVGKKVVVEGVVESGLELLGKHYGIYILADKVRGPHFWEEIPIPFLNQ